MIATICYRPDGAQTVFAIAYTSRHTHTRTGKPKLIVRNFKRLPCFIYQPVFFAHSPCFEILGSMVKPADDSESIIYQVLEIYCKHCRLVSTVWRTCGWLGNPKPEIRVARICNADLCADFGLALSLRSPRKRCSPRPGSFSAPSPPPAAGAQCGPPKGAFFCLKRSSVPNTDGRSWSSCCPASCRAKGKHCAIGMRGITFAKGAAKGRFERQLRGVRKIRERPRKKAFGNRGTQVYTTARV